MQLSSAIRAALIALTVIGAGLATAYADSGSIRFNVIKAGFVVGGSGGSGTLVFHGRRYPLSIGGVSYGFTFGASATDFVGTVSNIRSPSDVNGVYGAAGAGVARMADDNCIRKSPWMTFATFAEVTTPSDKGATNRRGKQV